MSMTNNKTMLIDGLKNDASLVDKTMESELHGNGSCESTPKILFGIGLPYGNPPQANLTQHKPCVMVKEVNAVEENPKEWWYDTGATTHICLDKDMFCSYQKCKSEERLFMGNTDLSKIEGCGKVVLKMTLEYEITLENVKYVPDMRKNLISGTLMSKAGFSIFFESDKLMLKKHGVFVGMGYVQGGLVKMNVMTVLPKIVVTDVSINEKTHVA
ncbi:unnamed protein product, partial [Arabidopsis halleri]